tara:strand:- start:197 stop:301 length:105 start_codon:yes stop_codon:yes gene_type:complete
MKFSTVVIKAMLESETDEKKRKILIEMVYRIINS